MCVEEHKVIKSKKSVICCHKLILKAMNSHKVVSMNP